LDKTVLADLMKMLNDFQQNNNADECHSVACHGTYKLLITSKHRLDDFFPTLLCSIEQSGEFFFILLCSNIIPVQQHFLLSGQKWMRLLES